MTETIVSYECPETGLEHAVPGEDVRVMMVGDGGFVVACECGPEPLDDVDSRPHASVDHLVNIYVDAPSASEWLALEAAADGWYDTSAWEPADGYDGTNGQRRARVRDRMQSRVDAAETSSSGGATAADEAARAVACPACDATEGRKCQRPSGHRVRKSHADRKQLARTEGILGPEDAGNEAQVTLQDALGGQ